MRLARVGLSLAVAFWMAGAGCLLGCEAMVSAASDNVSAKPAQGLAAIVSGDACASVKSHDCCAKHGAKSTPKSATESSASRTSSDSSARPKGERLVTATSAPMMSCPLALNASAILSKSGVDQDSAPALPARTINPVTVLPVWGSAFLHPLRLPNRGHTYLRCCVFLI